MRTLMILILATFAAPIFGAHGDRFILDAGASAMPSDMLCGDIAASDGANTIVCSGEQTLVFEKIEDTWSVFAPALPMSTSVAINFEGNRFVVGDGLEARLYERDISNTPDNRSDDTWTLIHTFPGGSDVGMDMLGTNILVGDYLERKSTLYCGSDMHACRTVDGSKPVAIDALGFTITATDPDTGTVYYNNGGVQRALSGPPNSDFGASLNFGVLGFSYLIVGAPEEPNAQGIPSGSCHFYHLESVGGQWDFLPFGWQDAPEGLEHGRFCHSTGAWNHPFDMLVGAPMANNGQGAAFKITNNDGVPTEFLPILTSGPDSDHFGWSVFVQRAAVGEGQYLIIGEPFNDGPGLDAGSALLQHHNPRIFSDGFESGDTCSWTQTCPGG